MSTPNLQLQTYHALPLPKVTPSGVSDLHCPRKFWQLRVLKQWPARAPLSFGAFGTALHKALASLYDKRDGFPDPDAIESCVRHAMVQLRYSDSESKAADADRLCRMIYGYIQQDVTQDPEAVYGTFAVERVCQSPMMHDGKPLFLLAATLDRLIVRASEPHVLIVRDYKTSAPQLNFEEAYVMLWAAKRMYGTRYEEYRLELDFIDEGGRFQREVITPSDCSGIHKWIVRQLLEQLGATEHPETPTEVACRWCPLKEKCSAIMGQSGDIMDAPFGEE